MRPIPLRRWPVVRFAVGAGLLWLFVDITGGAPSAVRAFVMAVFLQAALLLMKPASVWAALVASAFAVLVVAPLQVFGASFVMSYGIVAALLLLWHELVHLSGKPMGVLIALLAAASWALGTQQIRHTKMMVPTLTIVFWMTGMTAVVMSALATWFEMDRWAMPPTATWASIIYNAIGVFVFAQAAWLGLARSLPPLASSLSVMFIPVLGVFSGAWWLGEVLHWQDWAAVALMMTSIACVLLPQKTV